LPTIALLAMVEDHHRNARVCELQTKLISRTVQTSPLGESRPTDPAPNRAIGSPRPLDPAAILNEICWRGYFSVLGLRQALTGTPVASYPQPNPYDVLSEMKRAQWMKEELLNRRVLKKVRGIVTHAYRHVPYYSRLYKSLGLHPDQLSTLDELRSFPVVTKEDLRAAGNQALADDTDSTRVSVHATSGSTGTPFQFYLDAHCWWRRLASKWLLDSYFGARPQSRYFRILNVPAPPESANRGASFRDRLRAFLGLVSLDRDYAFPYSEITEEKLPQLAARLRKLKPKYGAATPTQLLLFSEVLSRRYVQMPRVQALISGTETLLDTERRRFEEVFDAPVFNRYGSREFYGAVAGECEYHVGLHVNLDLVLVEVVRDNGEPCSHGEVGSIVITDFYNRCMPFVRYNIGDNGSLESACDCGRSFPMIGRLIGRSSEWVLNRDNTKIPLASLRIPEVLAGQVRSFQFEQTAPGRLTMYLVPQPGWNEPLVRDKMTSVGLANGVELDYEIVEQVKPAPSGKRTLILPSAS